MNINRVRGFGKDDQGKYLCVFLILFIRMTDNANFHMKEAPVTVTIFTIIM